MPHVQNIVHFKVLNNFYRSVNIQIKYGHGSYKLVSSKSITANKL